jgi:hypothetical protein
MCSYFGGFKIVVHGALSHELLVADVVATFKKRSDPSNSVLTSESLAILLILIVIY